jgi:flagellar biosynthetic protein FlhB
MTRQEVKDELKDTEGRPEVKSTIREKQQQLARQRMMAEVPDADVVITNPTHFAVALKYDQTGGGAPRVVAKGKGLIANRIRDIAREHGVPLFSAPPLARALYFSTELHQEIPRNLFLAVAQVLAYLFQLRQARKQGNRRPVPPRDLPVPEEYTMRDAERVD